MKFPTDENIGSKVVIALRELQFDITSVLEDYRGSEDKEILSLANQEDRIVITTDNDFGELVNAEKLVHHGVILLRLKKDSSENKLRYLQYLFINHSEELDGEFTVIKDNLIRIGKKRVTLQFN